jgi:hypothetical protein
MDQSAVIVHTTPRSDTLSRLLCMAWHPNSLYILCADWYSLRLWNTQVNSASWTNGVDGSVGTALSVDRLPPRSVVSERQDLCGWVKSTRSRPLCTSL